VRKPNQAAVDIERGYPHIHLLPTLAPGKRYSGKKSETVRLRKSKRGISLKHKDLHTILKRDAAKQTT
jgi:hypothetical protein